MYIKVVYLVCQ